jgi:hypothetical protein
MASLLREFEDALIVRNVVARVTTAMEHSSPEEMKEYLHLHPNADPKDHRVEKGKGKGKSAPEGKPPIKNLVQNTKRLSESVAKDSAQLTRLQKSFDSAASDRNGNERSKAIAGKINSAYDSAISNSETAFIHAQSAINLARKSGASEDEISRVESQLENAKKAIKEAKEDGKDKPIEGKFAEKLMVGYKVESIAEVEQQVGALHQAIQLLSSG